jgi:nitrite reductase/ring-hydroxylating ferredoxin subunit
VFWTDDGAFALLDRCPHMGFPLHLGSVDNGLLICHWHHAQFELATNSACMKALNRD